MIEVSVIIVSYNTKALTLQCIQSVLDHVKSVNFEIIVVDNASKDGSAEAIKSTFPGVRVIANSDNIGFGRANNQGILASDSEFIFLLNSDAYLVDDALSPFVAFMRANGNEDVGACGGELLSGSDRKVVSYGNFPSIFQIVSSLGPFIFYRKYYEKCLAEGVVNDCSSYRAVDYISGADMFMRRTAINRAGVFDEDFFLYYEETELSFRFKKLGIRSVIIPDAKIIHLEGGSQKTKAPFNYTKFTMFSSSRHLFFKKCYGSLYAFIAKILDILQLIIRKVLGRDEGNLARKIKIVLFS